MLLIRSPSFIFALVFSLISMILMILTFNIGYKHPEYRIQFLIILPPLNSIFLFLLSLTWLERRFRLSYLPLICLILLLFSSLTLTIISSLFLSISILIYFNLFMYSFFSMVFFIFLVTLIVLYLSGSLYIHRYRNRMTIEQRTNPISKANYQAFAFDQFPLRSSEHEVLLFMSKLPGRRIRSDMRDIIDDLKAIPVDTILTLNESKEFSIMTMSNNNCYTMDTYSTHITRTNIEHLIYPIRNYFLPKSIGDYMQYLYTIILNFKRSHRHRLLIHCLDGTGRTGMTIVCFQLLYDYMMNENERERSQTFIERICHYPFLFENSCRVCQSVFNLRQIRSNHLLNPLQIFFIHEFYARLKSSSYMAQIANLVYLHEQFLLNTFD